MPEITIYTKSYCGYCRKAKFTLEQEGWSYKEIDITDDPKVLTDLQVKTGMFTVPQIFVGDEFIGGSDDLERRIEEVREMMKV